MLKFSSFPGPFPPGCARKNVLYLKDTMLSYLLACYARVEEEEKSLKKVKKNKDFSLS